MVIHTKQKAKIHTLEPKQASIKGKNIYTVDRDPTKQAAMIMIQHQKKKIGLRFPKNSWQK